MRVSPPLLFQLNTFRAWRVATASLSALAAAALSAWALTAPDGRHVASWVAAALGLLGIAVLFRWLWTVPTRAVQLLWDGHAWHLSTVGATQSATTGRIDIALDAGLWMLLTFTPDGVDSQPFARHPLQWLPAERQASAAEWHALRYTLHGNARRLRSTAGPIARGPRP